MFGKIVNGNWDNEQKFSLKSFFFFSFFYYNAHLLAAHPNDTFRKKNQKYIIKKKERRVCHVANCVVGKLNGIYL